MVGTSAAGMLVRTLQCPHCGGRTKIARGQLEAHCLHCGQPVKLSDAMLQEQGRAARYGTRTFVRLGMKAKLAGAEYEVVGRQVFQQQEDGETYQWEEWVLISDEGAVQYLEFDEGKWKLSEPFVPQEPVGPQTMAHLQTGSILRLDGKNAMVRDKGAAVIVHAEGEFPFVVRLMEPRGFLDAGYGDRFYSVEWTEDAVEYFHGRYVDLRQLYSAFGMQKQLAALETRAKGFKQRQLFGGVSLCTALAALVIWIYSFFSGAAVPGATGSVSLAQIQGENGQRFGPFRLTAVGRVHRLELHGRMREESNWVQAILEDAEEQELLASERDMWDESGYEDGEYWHESDLSASTDFVLKKPGDYYVRLYTEPDTGRGTSQSATASFAIKHDVVYPVYLGVYGFVALFIGILCLVVGKPVLSNSGGE